MGGWEFTRILDPEEEVPTGSEVGISEDGSRIITSDNIELLFPDWQEGEENVVLPGPQEDDISIGAGLLVQAVLAYGGNVHFLVVTDGKKGYWHEDDKERVYGIRVNEMESSSGVLGVPEDRITRFDYPDGDLIRHCTTSDIHDPSKEGLIMRMTRYFRDCGATRIVVPTAADPHPDHIYTNMAARISVFHANGEIWQQCGEPTNITTLLESYVYYPPSEPIPLALMSPSEAFMRKIAAIDAFNSQRQIEDIVENNRAGGNREVFSTVPLEGHRADRAFEKYFKSR